MNQQKMEQILSFMREETYKPLTVQELEEALHIEDADEFKELVITLNQMEEEGQIVRTRSNRYGLPEKMNLLRGTVVGHARGFAFVEPSEPGFDDVFIPPGELNNAMHGDTVLVRLSSKTSGARQEGTVIRILERGVVEIVGTYTESKILVLSYPMIKRLPMIFLFQKTLKMER